MARKLLYLSATIALLCLFLMFVYSWLNPSDFPFGPVFGLGLTLAIMLVSIVIIIIQNIRKASKNNSKFKSYQPPAQIGGFLVFISEKADLKS